MINKIFTLTVIFSAVSAFSVSAADNVLQIFNQNNYTPESWAEIENIEFNSAEEVMIVKTVDGNAQQLNFSNLPIFKSGETLPLIEITTDTYMPEVPNKVDYQNGTFNLRGFGRYDNVSATMGIRGRGNSSWGYEKKPYRLKFDKKQSLCGLPKAKSFVLLANSVDPSFMENSIASMIADIVEFPNNRPMIPVDVNFNGIYKGTYLLTNKPGINSGSVDIDEKNSIMWELDSYFDEDYKFKSPIYNLPVNVSDPDLLEISGDDPQLANDLFDSWKADFIEMERAVAEGKAADYIDLELYGKYLLIYDITKNDELQHPKSVKLYKTRGEGNKYIFGPIWDFDGAWGFWMTFNYGSTDKIDQRVTRHAFFKQLEQYPEVRESYRVNFEKVKAAFPQLLERIDQYAETIRTSAERNNSRWGIKIIDSKGISFDDAFTRMRAWLVKRMECIENFDIMQQ